MFGHAPTGVQATVTDLWDRADATPTQQIYVAPTQARKHTIASTSASDDGPAGVGARLVQIWGLQDWNTPQISEVVEMDGAGGNVVQTINDYVIINRMEVVASGTTNINVGVITATANTDSSVSATIRVGLGQTQMAVCGVPRGHSIYIKNMQAAMHDNNAQSRIDFALRVNKSPQLSPLNVLFTRADSFQVQNSGSSHVDRLYTPHRVFHGPAIVKVQAIASAADMDGYASVNGYIVRDFHEARR